MRYFRDELLRMIKSDCDKFINKLIHFSFNIGLKYCFYGYLSF